MEYEKIKSEIKDIVAIVKECPENLQEKCFEILLNNLLGTAKPSGQSSGQNSGQQTNSLNKGGGDGNQNGATDGEKDLDEEIALKDLHAKTKRFMESNTLTIQEINKLYYKDDGKILPLYDAMASNKISESQVRLSLLTAFENSMENGEFEFSGEVVRERCKIMKCYDGANFSTNFKNSKMLFDGFEQYEKESKIKLSTAGKIELSKLLKELAK